MKVMIFNEFYNICSKKEIDFNNVRELMLRNNWINSMHTNVPGPDGKIAYGGACFTKDTNALLEYAKRNNCLHKILEASIYERDLLRNDQENIIKQNVVNKNEN